MSQTTAQTEVLQAIHDGALSPYGAARVQMQDTTGYIAIPIELVEAYGLQQGFEVRRAFHPETDCLIICLRENCDTFSCGL